MNRLNEGKRINWNERWNELLPKNVVKLLKITPDGSFVNDIKYRGKVYSSLTQLNDDGVKFKAISKIIRKQFDVDNFEPPTL